MSETKFTPGPYAVVAADSEEGLVSTGTFAIVTEADDEVLIAVMLPLTLDEAEMPYEANAYLLAAAPDLYEALEECREAIDILFARIIENAPRDADPATYHPSKSGKPWDATIRSLAVLKKARGEA